MYPALSKEELTERDPLIKRSSEVRVLIPSTSKVKYYSNDKVGCWTRRKRRKLAKEYYEELEELQKLYTQDEEILAGQRQRAETERSPDRVLARIAFMLNVILLFTNLTASVLSGSLSIISTFIDSLMDITSSVVISVCLWLIHNTNTFNYPRGRSRLELLGVVLCSIIMGVANMAIIMESITAILSNKVAPEVDFITLGLMLGGASVKFVLMLACYKRGTASTKVLAMDMRNDICTALGAIVCAVIGDRYWKYADPLGAIIVCGVIAISWFNHALEQVPMMVGVRGEREQLSRILKVAIEHDQRIKCIDHVVVYHTGLEAIVEMHIVMDEDLPLKVTHDISHPLEKKLMMLDFVERAFVHCDYYCDGD